MLWIGFETLYLMLMPQPPTRPGRARNLVLEFSVVPVLYSSKTSKVLYLFAAYAAKVETCFVSYSVA